MTTEANWTNFDPIEDESDTPVIQPPLKAKAQRLGVADLGGTIWFGQQPAPSFSLSLDLDALKTKK